VKKKESSFIGFFDGYKAGNIAFSEPSLKVYKNNLINQIKNLINTNEPDKILIFEKLIKSLEKNNNENIYQYILIIEAIKLFIDTNDPEIFKTNDQLLQSIKKIIYDLLNVSEKIEDSELSSLVIEIAESFNEIIF